MPDSRFPILGTVVPPMLGRAAILQKMTGALTKPDHLQVVGPGLRARRCSCMNWLPACGRRDQPIRPFWSGILAIRHLRLMLCSWYLAGA